jgi:signal transduction histidine kinase
MVAGIAREINNSINFIHGNVQHMNGYIQDLLKLIQLYQQTYPDRTREIHEMSNSLDLPFIATDLPKMMDSMKSGSEQIHNMVLSLQNFSRLDESEKNPTALHKSLDNTLVLLGHRLNFDDGTPKILINRDYQDIPLINCYAAQINQVFVHVLNNSIDALELVDVSRSASSPPAINIGIKTIGLYYVQIQIQDNGIGIAPEIFDHIFEPFFTTKARSEGAGLGLAICHKVMQKHSGSITVQSVLGQGSTCRLQFPIQLAVS